MAVPSDALRNLVERTHASPPHVCAFFESPEEEMQCLSSFIIEGLDRGEKALHIIDPSMMDRYVHLLEGAGIPVRVALETGQFEIVTWERAYLRTGGFDQFDMLECIQEMLRKGREEGYPLTRLVAHMEFALTGCCGAEDLVEYEARVDEVLSQYPDPVVCVYDTNRFGAGVALDVLRTHPLAIIGGSLHTNPFYVPPAEFLKEIRKELATTTGG